MKTKDAKWYKKAVDKARRAYIRKRDLDSRGYAQCITCKAVKQESDLQVGHIFSRVNDFSSEIGGDERAVNLQCESCNGFRHGEGALYCLAVDEKYGKGTCVELKKKRDTLKKWSSAELRNLLQEYQDKLVKLL